jgi:hypothetical protein
MIAHCFLIGRQKAKRLALKEMGVTLDPEMEQWSEN